jgi:hypothetical protein
MTGQPQIKYGGDIMGISVVALIVLVIFILLVFILIGNPYTRRCSMFRPGYLLDTDEKLDAALFNQSEVSVWKRGKILNYGGRIEHHDEISVHINDGVFQGYL